MGQDDFDIDQIGNSHHWNGASRDDCEAARVLLPAYSLEATDPDETRFVESLLDRCPEAVAELAAYNALVQKLLFSAPPAAAPVHLREKVLASVRSNPISATSRTPAVRAYQPEQYRLAKPLWHPALLAAALAIVFLSLLNLYWAAQIAALQATQQEIAQQLHDHTDVLTLIGAGETQRIELSNPDRTALAVLVCDPEEPLGFVYAEDFPPLPPDRVYQVWLIRGQQRISAGTFLVDENGEATIIFRASEPLGYYQAVEITSETTNATQPASDVIVSGLLNY